MNTNFSTSKVRIFKNVNPKNEPIHLIFPCLSNFLLSKNLNQHFHRHFERALTFSLNRYFSIESFQFLLIWENLETDATACEFSQQSKTSLLVGTCHEFNFCTIPLSFLHFRLYQFNNVFFSSVSGAKIWILFSSGKTIFYERAQQVSKILFLPRENKIHIFKPPCNVLVIIQTKRHR